MRVSPLNVFRPGVGAERESGNDSRTQTCNRTTRKISFHMRRSPAHPSLNAHKGIQHFADLSKVRQVAGATDDSVIPHRFETADAPELSKPAIRAYAYQPRGKATNIRERTRFDPQN